MTVMAYYGVFWLLAYCSVSKAAAPPLPIPDPKQAVFEYVFTIDWKLTMAWYNQSSGYGSLLQYDVDRAEYNVRNSNQMLLCNATLPLASYQTLDTVMTADGKHRRMIMINGQLPGPTVVVPYGAEVVVKIENRLAMEGVTIHFHGMDKRDAWFMDGVAHVQQCPISAGSDFYYRFKADTPGTHWYHGHLGGDRAEGVFGAMVVMPEDRRVTTVDGAKLIPDVEYSVMLYDWNANSGSDLWFNHLWRTMKFLDGYENQDDCWRPRRMVDGTHIGGSYPMSAVLVNQKGWYNQKDVLERPYKLDLEEYKVQKGGKAYLFRVANGGQALPLLLTVEDHDLQIVSTDGAPIKPIETQFLTIFPGERYDFLLISKNETRRKTYYMIVETFDYYDYWWQRINPDYGLAKITYTDVDSEHETYVPDIQHSRCTMGTPCTVVNCPFPHYPADHNRTCVNLGQMRYAGQKKDEELLQQKYDRNYEEYFLNMHYDNVMNKWLFKYPKGPPYFYANNENAVMYSCTDDNWKGTRNSWCTYTLNITLNNVVQLVLYNAGVGGDMADGFHHPVHLHGTHFRVVKVGYGTYNETTGMLQDNTRDFPCNVENKEQCDDLTWTNSSWMRGNIPDMVLDNPVSKDSITLPVGGYVVLRFKAENPGWWVMHCHIMVHHMGGMAFAVRVGKHEEMPKPPSNFPQCGVFDFDDSPKTTAAHLVTTSGAFRNMAGQIVTIYLIMIFGVISGKVLC